MRLEDRPGGLPRPAAAGRETLAQKRSSRRLCLRHHRLLPKQHGRFTGVPQGLSGPIPFAIGELLGIEGLFMGDNQLTGDTPQKRQRPPGSSTAVSVRPFLHGRFCAPFRSGPSMIVDGAFVALRADSFPAGLLPAAAPLPRPLAQPSLRPVPQLLQVRHRLCLVFPLERHRPCPCGPFYEYS